MVLLLQYNQSDSPTVGYVYNWLICHYKLFLYCTYTNELLSVCVYTHVRLVAKQHQNLSMYKQQDLSDWLKLLITCCKSTVFRYHNYSFCVHTAGKECISVDMYFHKHFLHKSTNTIKQWTFVTYWKLLLWKYITQVCLLCKKV